MSKLSFRARALDVSKPMPVYKSDEIPDLPDFAAINRAVPQMPTGMEKEEESEHHLQRALSAQQVYGTAEALVIPVPEISEINKERHGRLYGVENAFKVPKQYVHVQAFGMDQEIPDYDMDSEDEAWLNKQTKKMDVTPLKFENMMDRLEKGSGQMVVTVEEAKALLKEDDDLIIAVYDYWLNKRLRTQNRLIPQVKTEKRDGSTTNDPYVAFRRRTEKMQTRKNRKNDEVSYEKMLKLRRDLNRALTILEMMKRREKSKKELLQLTIEIYEKRYQMQDWSGTNLAEAEAQRHKMPPTYIQVPFDAKSWARQAREESGYKKKREYKKRKHKTPSSSQHTNHTHHHHHHHHHHHASHQSSSSQLPQYSDSVLHPHHHHHHHHATHQDAFSSDEEQLSSPLSPAEPAEEEDPDGVYAFRRKANCHYHAPISDGMGNWPWCGREEGGFGEKRFRYCLTSLSIPRPRCVGYARRRVGRGGRIILDRAFSDWDDYLTDIDFTAPPPQPTSKLSTLIRHIKDNRLPSFRPRSPVDDSDGDNFSSSGNTAVENEFNAETFHSHQEALLAMQRHQMDILMKPDNDMEPGFDLDQSFSSQPTSRFTLDSASAQFAASAVCNSTQELIQTTAVSGSGGGSATSDNTVASAAPLVGGATSTISAVTSSQAATSALNVKAALSNGPMGMKASSNLSTAPAATILQLNFPSAPAAGAAAAAPHSSSSSLQSQQQPSSTAATPVIGNSKSQQQNSQSLFKQLTAAAGTTPNNKHDTLSKDNNHEGVNSLVKDQVVAMEVT